MTTLSIRLPDSLYREAVENRAEGGRLGGPVSFGGAGEKLAAPLFEFEKTGCAWKPRGVSGSHVQGPRRRTGGERPIVGSYRAGANTMLMGSLTSIGSP